LQTINKIQMFSTFQTKLGRQENGNFPLLYVVKMSFGGYMVKKSLKTPLRNIKVAPSKKVKDIKPTQILVTVMFP
jgi:hypothetical protein